jgi:hypothetical protein
MKITVITGQDGEIVGTARHGDGKAGVGNGSPIAGPGQTAHEIELPSHFEKIESVDEYHRALKHHLQSGEKA